MLYALLFSATALAAMPTWISDSFQKNGSMLMLVCSGKGETIAKARSEAMNSCVQSAGEQLPTTWKLKSKSEETMENTSLKKEVLADQRIEGLSCNVQREYVDANSDSPTVYVKCLFNLAKAKSTALNMEKVTAANAVSIDARPGCDHISIWGGPYARKVPCEEGRPTVVTVVGDEYEIAIIKDGGYQAKTIKLNRDVSYQEFVVHLEKRNFAREEWERSGDREKEMKGMRPEDFEFAPRSAIPY